MKFLFEGVATKTIKADLEYRPPLIISYIFSLMKIIEATISIQENTVFEEPLFNKATSSKTDKLQTVFTETSMEATPFVDVSSVSCQDCKVKTT